MARSLRWARSLAALSYCHCTTLLHLQSSTTTSAFTSTFTSRRLSTRTQQRRCFWRTRLMKDTRTNMWSDVMMSENRGTGIEILPARQALPQLGPDGVTVVSFNVLLPNGNDGWWIFKSFQPHVPDEHRTWPYRQALMREYLLKMNADVVCVQEASAESFELDFGFMKDAGYDFVLHAKFRFRTATFFKADKLELTLEKHKDRVLITGFRTLPNAMLPALPPPIFTDGAEPDRDAGGARPSSSSDNLGAIPSTMSNQKSTPDGSMSKQSPSSTNEKGETLPNGKSELSEGPKTETAIPPPETSTGEAKDNIPAVAIEEEPPAKEDADKRLLMVVNCHLTGGPVPERRMRQVFDALDTVRKEAAKVESGPTVKGKGEIGHQAGGKTQNKKGAGKNDAPASSSSTSVPVIVCGDLNSDGRTAVWELLTKGILEASFREEGYPKVAITSKGKKHAFGSFADVYEEAYGAASTHPEDRALNWGRDRKCPPSTFIVPLLHPHFLDDDGESLSPRLKIALSEVFHKFASNHPGNGFTESVASASIASSADQRDNGSAAEPDLSATATTPSPQSAMIMSRDAVDAWLLKINRGLGRGSEFRAAEASMGPGPGGGLTLEGFFSIYLAELVHGKFWGVAFDLHACGVELPGGMPWVGPLEMCLDHVFYSKETLEAVGAMEPLTEEQRELVRGGDCLPNSWHPSDHVAVAGAFRFR